MNQLGIVNGRVYINGVFYNQNLYVREGVISAITCEKLPCEQEIDAAGKMVLPGFIDPHVHFALTVGTNTSADDFYSGSVKGALGGITTYIDFLNPIKEAAQVEEAWEERMKLADSSVTDYAFHTTIANPTDTAEHIINAGLKLGIPSVKLFTTYSNTDRRTYDNTIYSFLKLSSEMKTRILIHAENDHLIDTNPEILVKDHEKSRPVISETTEMMKLALMARETKGLLYFVHVSAGSTAKMLQEYFSKELAAGTITLESCPHYFLLNRDNYEKENGYEYTMTPPLRSEEERNLMREYIGSFSTIGTDHCPFDLELKNRTYTRQVPMGIGGIQYSFGNMFTEFGSSVISKFTDGPAKAYGIYPRKGNLLPGADADIVIYDDSVIEQIQEENSVYRGRMMQGRVDSVFLRGKQIVQGKQFLDSKGLYIRRKINE